MYRATTNSNIPGTTVCLTTAATNARTAIIIRVRHRCDVAAVDANISSGTAVSSTTTTSATNTCATNTCADGKSSTLSGNRATIYLDGTAVAAISRAWGTASNACAAIPSRRTTSCVDYAAMNGNAAAVKDGGAAADACAGIVAAVSCTCGVQRPGAARLGVDGQAVAGGHHNALFRCEGTAIHQN